MRPLRGCARAALAAQRSYVIMTSLILLEDEPVLREELAEFLETTGFHTTPVESLAAFHRAFEAGTHRIAIIDLGLPDGDGLELITALRGAGHRLGIIVLTAHGATADRVAGLIGGADYYLAKTIDLAELAAIVTALARRLDAQAAPRWVLQRAPRQLVPPGYPPVPLSEQDYLVLETLATGGDCVTRTAIVRALGGDYLHYDQRRLDTQMRRLRRKVEESCGLSLPITTLRSVGFRFHAEVEVLR